MPIAAKEKEAEADRVPSDVVVNDISPTRRLTPKNILIKLLYNPLTWLAIGAHLLLLVVPFNPNATTTDVIEEPEEEVDESIPIDILNLSELATAAPPPETPPPPSPATPPPAPVPALAAPVPAPVAEVPAEAEPLEPEVPTEPESQELEVPVEEVLQDPPAYDPTGNQNYFVGQISNLGIDTYEGVVAYPDSRDFEKGNGDSFLDFTNPIDPAPLPTSRDAVYMDEQLSDVITTLNNSYGGSVNITPVQEYAGELLYELSDGDGNVFLHVSLVEFRSGSTLLVMWPANPNG